MNAQVNNKDLIEIYKKTIHNIEKEVKRINFFNKIHYIKHYDFIINTIEKIVKRKYDFMDHN